MTKEGNIRFYSDAPLEDIEATNQKVSSILSGENGTFIFKLKVSDFHFENSLMEEHFNENYMESEKYPESSFKGRIMDFSNVDLSKEKTYHVSVTGDLTVHGVTKKVIEKGVLVVKDNEIQATAKFMIHIADYKVEIPTVVIKNIAEDVEVTVDVLLSSKTK